MKKWLENYNDSSVSTGPGFVGMGNDTTDRNYSPAWGGQFQDGGKMTLPEVTVHTHKDKDTRTFYNNILNKWKGEDDLDYARYKGLMKLNEQVGFPKVSESDDPNYRAHYNPLTDRMSIKKGNLNDYIEELSHAKQVRDLKGIGNYTLDRIKGLPNDLVALGKGAIGLLDGQSPYEAMYKHPGTVEYNAHKIIAPKLHNQYAEEQSKVALGEDWNSLSEKEKKEAISNMKRQHMAMGGSVPGAVGFMYARTQNPAPSNGKYAKKTQASAQNGEEMKYYQDGLDFRPKSISQNGSSLDMNLFDLNTQAAQDATRNVIPRKMTAKEKKEAEAAGNAARKKSAEKAKAIVEERMKNRSSKGDLNTPGSWHTEDKLRLFPESVGGLGEMYDEYINPGVIVGGMSDLLGESVAARNPVGVATALGVSAGLGALGVDPLGTALKYKNAGSNYLKGLRAQGHQVQGAGLSHEELSRMYDELVDTRATNRIQNRIQPRQYNEPVPYQPPTDEELLAMNQVEANRYYRRPSQTQNVPDPNSFNWTPNSDIAERMRRSGEQIELRLARDLGIDESRLAAIRQQASDAYSTRRTGLDALRQENEEFARLIAPDAPEGAGAQEIEESFAQSTPYTRPEPVNTPQQTGPVFGQKDYKMEDIAPGDTSYTDPSTGDVFSQNISHEGNDFVGKYSARGNRSSIDMSVRKNTTDPYLNVRDITFFSHGDNDNALRASTTKKLNKMMSSLPPKINMDYISTSMYSQPIMNQQVARWANNNPGRIEVQDVIRRNLNNIVRDMPRGYQGTRNEHYLEQLIDEFPNVQRTYKTLAETTGYPFNEPTIAFRNPQTGVKETLTLDQIQTPEFKQWYKDNNIGSYDIGINVDKYRLKKHWKQGGHIIDEMGQWAHPGEITTIPSNNITMKGVDYDVLGVSNTGDKKLMKPGKNYKFDGDYVTEYPKGGWLNKYK